MPGLTSNSPPVLYYCTGCSFFPVTHKTRGSDRRGGKREGDGNNWSKRLSEPERWRKSARDNQLGVVCGLCMCVCGRTCVCILMALSPFPGVLSHFLWAWLQSCFIGTSVRPPSGFRVNRQSLSLSRDGERDGGE